MPKSQFDIIITSFNRIKYLSRCLRAIEKYTAEWDYQVTVVDNGSSDGSKYYLRKKEGINFISLKKNFGPSFAFNCGFQATRREFVVRLDDDTEVTAGWLGGIYASLVKGGRVGIVSPKIVLGDGRIFLAESLPKYYALYGYREIDRGQRDYIRHCDLLPGPAMLFKRRLVDKIGLFDERLMCCEDMDFCLRARSKGYKLIYNGKHKIIHHHLRRLVKYAEESERRFHRKWSGFKIFPLRDSHLADRYNTWGLNAMVGKKYSQAFNYFEKAYSLDRRFGLPLFMGISLAQMSRLKEAAQKLKEALYFNPADFRANYYLGTTYRKLGKEKEACGWFRKALINTTGRSFKFN